MKLQPNSGATDQNGEIWIRADTIESAAFLVGMALEAHGCERISTKGDDLSVRVSVRRKTKK